MPALIRLVLLLCLCLGLAQQGVAAALRGVPGPGTAAMGDGGPVPTLPCHAASPNDAADAPATGACSVCAACCMALALPAPLPEWQLPRARESWWLDPTQAPPAGVGSTLFRPPRSRLA